MGTTAIFDEYTRIKNIFVNDYCVKKLSVNEIMVKYSIPSERTINRFFEFFDVESRDLSQSQYNWNEKKGVYENKSDKEIYLKECNFDFGFTLELQGFDLISKYGIYDPVSNVNGIVRDHAFSKVEGWNHQVPSKIISSPANCIYMLQSDNASKNSDCSITIEQLYERYKLWKKGLPLPIVEYKTALSAGDLARTGDLLLHTTSVSTS